MLQTYIIIGNPILKFLNVATVGLRKNSLTLLNIVSCILTHYKVHAFYEF